MRAVEDWTPQEEHEANENSLKLLDDIETKWMRTTPWWVDDEHLRQFRCDYCNYPLGFQEADGIGDKIYHQFCSAKLSRKG